MPKRKKLRPSRVRLLAANIDFSAGVPNGSMVLDAGAGHAPYEHLFNHAKYEAADFNKVPGKRYTQQTYICDLASIPVEDGRFDYVVFNQVLEHLPNPSRVLCELNRVLKFGGQMICSAPLFYEEHDAPYDFYRYTQYGLRHLLEEAGFEIIRFEWLEGYFGTLGHQLHYASSCLPPNSSDYGGGIAGSLSALTSLPIRVLFRAFAIYYNWLELRHKFTGRGLPKNYVAIVRKVADPRAPAKQVVASEEI
jgi:SAM-dependent methyltransferase